jgi:hypothetical protein
LDVQVLESVSMMPGSASDSGLGLEETSGACIHGKCKQYICKYNCMRFLYTHLSAQQVGADGETVCADGRLLHVHEHRILIGSMYIYRHIYIYIYIYT